MTVVTIRPDRPAATVDADTVRQALAHLNAHGLRQDGLYGEPGEACCAVGHVAAITRDLHLAEEAAEDAFRGWPGRPAVSAGGYFLIGWSDYYATPSRLAAFYRWWIHDLEGGQ